MKATQAAKQERNELLAKIGESITQIGLDIMEVGADVRRRTITMQQARIRLATLKGNLTKRANSYVD